MAAATSSVLVPPLPLDPCLLGLRSCPAGLEIFEVPRRPAPWAAFGRKCVNCRHRFKLVFWSAKHTPTLSGSGRTHPVVCPPAPNPVAAKIPALVAWVRDQPPLGSSSFVARNQLLISQPKPQPTYVFLKQLASDPPSAGVLLFRMPAQSFLPLLQGLYHHGTKAVP